MRRPLVVLAFAAVSILWGSTYFGIRVALEAFAPFMLGAIRFLLAGAALFVVARVRGEAAPRAAEWRGALVTGALFFVVGNGLVNVAERSVSSGLASVLVATMPLWAALFSRFFGERVQRSEVLGIALGVVGVAVMNVGSELRASEAGAATALLAPMGWALGSLASKRMTLPAGLLMRTASQMLAGGAGMLLVSLLLREPFSPAPSARAVAAIAYLAVFGSIVGFSAFAYLLANVRASLATSYAYVNPVIAVALGVAVGGEHLDGPSAIGAAIIVAAVVVVARARGRERMAPPSPRRAPAVTAEI